MGRLTETEIFDQMVTSFRVAAELADDLAKIPLKGPTYNRLRTELRLIEGCCKQASTWREDTRWLDYGKFAAECHKRAGDWLRGIKMPDGSRVKLSAGTMHPAFTMLAEILRKLLRVAEDTKTKATGKVGMILPATLAAPHRDTKPVGYRAPPNLTKGGIIIPDSVSLH